MIKKPKVVKQNADGSCPKDYLFKSRYMGRQYTKGPRKGQAIEAEYCTRIGD